MRMGFFFYGRMKCVCKQGEVTLKAEGEFHIALLMKLRKRATSSVSKFHAGPISKQKKILECFQVESDVKRNLAHLEHATWLGASF